MKTTDKAFEKISLHDATIERIERTDDSIALFLRFAYLLGGHPENALSDDRLVCVTPTLTFLGVSKEVARTWSDQKRLWEDHRHPDQPLDNDIVEAKRESGYFFLDGLHADGWSEWKIWATAFTLTWAEEHPFE